MPMKRKGSSEPTDFHKHEGKVLNNPPLSGQH